MKSLLNKKYFSLTIFFILTACVSTENMNIPKAKKIPVELIQHEDVRIDNYYWLRDDSRSKEDVISYLKEENEYADMWFESKKPFKKELVEELVQQIPDQEISFPIENNGFSYYEKINKSDQLEKYYRKDSNNNEELLLDPNIKLKSQQFYSVGSLSPSHDNNLIGMSEDNNGRREYTIKFFDPKTGKYLNDVIEDTGGRIIWTKDNKHIIYTKKDPVTLISNLVYVHKIGTNVSDDVLIYKETDTEYNMSIYPSRSKEFIYINIEATNSNEIRLIDSSSPMNEPKVYIKRSDDHLYYLEHVESNVFIVLSNKNAPNFKILKSISDNNRDIDQMEEIIPHREDVFINDMLLVDKFLVLEIRENGLPEINIFDLESKSTNSLLMNDDAYDVSLSYNNEVKKTSFNYSYSSLTTPSTIYSYSFKVNKSLKLWNKDINNFNSNDYTDNRFFIKARDGKKIPAVVISKNTTNLENAPILFYGYGSYGINIDASFRSSLIPLLDRGFVFAIINIRGGGEMGKEWYEDGRMFNKLNTFYDFNDGVRAILNKGIGDKNNVFARGGSAGGLLIGSIINLEPSLYKGIISSVPFVDVLTTMSDPSIPLTTFEYDEWGNPANKEEYFYMKQYSPYDNISNLDYPAVFVTSSLYDSQVQYFEPAKYIAKLREFNTSDYPILMKMNLSGGHGGLSGRINQFEEIAEEYSFILNLVD